MNFSSVKHWQRGCYHQIQIQLIDFWCIRNYNLSFFHPISSRFDINMWYFRRWFDIQELFFIFISRASNHHRQRSLFVDISWMSGWKLSNVYTRWRTGKTKDKEKRFERMKRKKRRCIITVYNVGSQWHFKTCSALAAHMWVFLCQCGCFDMLCGREE